MEIGWIYWFQAKSHQTEILEREMQYCCQAQKQSHQKNPQNRDVSVKDTILLLGLYQILNIVARLKNNPLKSTKQRCYCGRVGKIGHFCQISKLVSTIFSSMQCIEILQQQRNKSSSCLSQFALTELRVLRAFPFFSSGKETNCINRNSIVIV